MFASLRSFEGSVEATTSNISLSTLQNALAGRYAFERELGTWRNGDRLPRS